MKQPYLSFVQAFIVAVGVLFLSNCNGGKLDPDLVDSISGKVSVEKITIDQEDFEMTEGESTVLIATVLPDDATDQTVSWNSSKEDVVMISNTGKTMAMAPGKSVITAKAGSKTDFITITVIAKEDPVSPPDPSGNFIGSYALDDGSGLTDTYFSFFKGTLSKYSLKQSGTKVVIAENSLWNTSVDDFSMDDTGEYAIENGTMYLKGVPYGTVSFSGNKMTLAGKEYTRFTGFKPERYSVIAVGGGSRITCDLAAQTLTIPVTLKTIPSGKLTVTSDASWVVPGEWKDGVCSFSVEENNSGDSRTAQVIFFYSESDPVSLMLTQTYAASSIVLESSYVSVPYTGEHYELSYSILNPRRDAILSVSLGAAWIRDFSVTDGKVKFRVSSTIGARSGVIRLQYGLLSGMSYASEQVSVSQQENPEFDEKASVSLSSVGTSNCYIINTAGQYKFPPVKGNSSTSVGNVAFSEVLWESFGTSLSPVPGDVVDAGYIDGYIHCKTPATLKNGNAVIAAKDASGNILWSWHIWVCSGYDPAATAQTYYNNAGVMMDRNLGATSATPGDVGALGLLYQWGRKDPFLGGCQISYSGDLKQEKAASTLSWPSPVSSTSSNGTITYATAHPTTFITSDYSNNYDWYYTGSSSMDNTRWQSSKTVYDPCPPGWRVPDGGDNGIWSKAVGSSSYFNGYPYDSTKMGMNFSGKFGPAATIWYPAAGYLYYDVGSLYYVGYYGYWWSCTPYDGNAYYLRLLSYGDVRPSGLSYRASGLAVRCLQE